MKICFLSSMHSPQDKRVFDKEAVSLAQAGFDVTHLAPGEPDTWHEQGVQIVTYEPPQSLIDRILQLPKLYRLAARLRADAYHCNEVDSWFVGVLLRCLQKTKVIFDVHEHYPSTFAESRFPYWLQPFVTSVVRIVFRALIPFTDRFVFAKKSVVPDFRGTEDKHVLVQNFTSLAYLPIKQHIEVDGKLPRPGTVITALHLGLISRLRGWPQLLDALARAQSQNLHLHIVGTFNDASQAAFDKRVSELGLEKRVRVEGWMPFDQAYQRLLSADIGLVLFQPGIQNHVYALPHKMFDYMLARLPVIAPNFAEEVAPIIAEANCGILVDPSVPEQIAEALDQLVTDSHERHRLGNNGRRAVLDRYNWEAEAEKLVKMYVELAERLEQ